VRFKSLDGARGIASLAVLLFHSSLIFISAQKSTYVGSFWIDIVAFSPLRFPFLGAEAVHLFFVLSGFTLPLLASKISPKTPRYILSRFVRLYPPVWVALSLLLVVYLVKNSESNKFGENIGLAGWVQDFLLFPVAGNALGALWSLTWEVLFSFTIFIWIKCFREGRLISQLVMLVAMVYLGDLLNVGLLEYLPMFFIGISLWSNYERFGTYFARSWLVMAPKTGLLVLAVLLTLPYTIAPILRLQIGGLEILRNCFYATEFLGLIALVGYALWSPMAGKFLQSYAVAWLGRISYSLYLVHQIVLMCVEDLQMPLVMTFALDVSISLLAAWLFYFMVEKRIHRLSRRIAASNP
jgi:peptidoglycan/LPS O-acetylase OafA/YrhL